MAWGRLNLTDIDTALAELGAAPRELIDADNTDEPFVADAVRRLSEGYHYIDSLLADQIEIFRYGQTGHILEINHRVLCGTTPERRVQYADHIAESERWFYDRPGAGIGAVFSWLQRHRTQPTLAIAAGIFVQVVSHPQLFIEGNARSATLLASYVLARGGLPPLVLTPATLPDYRNLTDRCLAIDRSGLTGSFAVSVVTNRVAAFLESATDRRFLLAEEAPVR